MNHHLRIAFQRTFFPSILLLAAIFSVWLGLNHKLELLPQLWISVFAAILGYWAWFNSSEKLRLDLFDRRFEIYNETLKYCSIVAQYGSLDLNEKNKKDIMIGLNAADESFRGIGYHKVRALFGQDIVALFDELNTSYAYISAFGGLRTNGDGYEPRKYWGHIKRTVDIANRLPELFKSYVYFGDHKQI